MSFASDEKWLEAKKVVGNRGNWLDVVDYYNTIDGKNTFVYSLIEGDKRLIVDIRDQDVLLINGEGELEVDEYEAVLRSRKQFVYTEKTKECEYNLRGDTITVIVQDRR